MKRALLSLGILLCFLAAPLIAQDTIEGKWKAKVKKDRIRLQMAIPDEEDFFNEWNYCAYYKKNDFTGLEWEKEHTFKLIREAGTVSFQGKFSGNTGSGDLVFQPEKKFENFLSSKGFEGISV
nr:hypothetical protein [Candidatus Aminicenantes bacterium]